VIQTGLVKWGELGSSLVPSFYPFLNIILAGTCFILYHLLRGIKDAQTLNAQSEYAGLMQLAQVLSTQNDYQEILRLTTQHATHLLEAEIATILMANPRSMQTVKTIHSEGSNPSPREFLLLQTLISGWIMKYHQAVYIADIKQDPRFSHIKAQKTAKTVLGVPIRVEGVVIGSLLVINRQNNGSFGEEELTFLEKLCMIAAPYLRNIQALATFFQSPVPSSVLLSKYAEFGLLGKSKRFLDLLHAIEAAGRSDVRVLLEGLSGTGKECVARAIHKCSSRAAKPFIAIDCGAIPSQLLESELFGHVKGSFTGAFQDRTGLLEVAHSGTLFMDEVSNLSMEMQAKLMRVLQDGEVRPVGSNLVKKTDVRIISATCTPLCELVSKGLFREDLYYRLLVYPIQVPSLHDRREDIPALAHHFLHRFSAQQNKRAETFSTPLLRFMQVRPWPGNVRELENFVERLLALTEASARMIDHLQLPDTLLKEFRRMQVEDVDASAVHKSLADSVDEFEEQIIRKALMTCHWNQSRAAATLRISEQTIRYKMARLGIIKPDNGK
jgi:transcriptional regulator with GAF, ATPase, and Fis domain